MANENAVAIRVRITRGIGTPQLLGRLNSTPGTSCSSTGESPAFCGTCPPIPVRTWKMAEGCLTILDLNDRTGLKKENSAGEVLRAKKTSQVGPRLDLAGCLLHAVVVNV